MYWIEIIDEVNAVLAKRSGVPVLVFWKRVC